MPRQAHGRAGKAAGRQPGAQAGRDRENKTATKEQNIQIGAGIANIDITTTTNYNETKRGGYEHYVQVGKENTEVTMEQTLISENLEIDAGVSALIGLEISINVNVIQMINDLLD